VINALSGLSDEFHVLNDVNLRFFKAIHWRERNEYIRTCQIDHIVLGPTGIFLVETKIWKTSDIEIKSDKLIWQVRRSSLALWYFLKDYYWRGEYPRIRTVIVSMHGFHSGKRLDKYIDVITPHQLCDYITNRKTILSGDAVKKNNWNFISLNIQLPVLFIIPFCRAHYLEVVFKTTFHFSKRMVYQVVFRTWKTHFHKVLGI